MDSGETLTHDLPLPFDLLYDEGFCLPAVHQKNKQFLLFHPPKRATVSR